MGIVNLGAPVALVLNRYPGDVIKVAIVDTEVGGMCDPVALVLRRDPDDVIKVARFDIDVGTFCDPVALVLMRGAGVAFAESELDGDIGLAMVPPLERPLVVEVMVGKTKGAGWFVVLVLGARLELKLDFTRGATLLRTLMLPELPLLSVYWYCCPGLAFCTFTLLMNMV